MINNKKKLVEVIDELEKFEKIFRSNVIDEIIDEIEAIETDETDKLNNLERGLEATSSAEQMAHSANMLGECFGNMSEIEFGEIANKLDDIIESLRNINVE
ncbi:MAG: hypothetical protein ACRC57_13840 [Sarcina sp.]